MDQRDKRQWQEGIGGYSNGATGVGGDGRVAAVGLRRRKPAKDGGKEEDGACPSPPPFSTSPGASICSKMGSVTAILEKKGERSSSLNDFQHSCPPTTAAVVCGVGPDGEGDERGNRSSVIINKLHLPFCC